MKRTRHQSVFVHAIATAALLFSFSHGIAAKAVATGGALSDGSLAAYLQLALEASPSLQAFAHRHEAALARAPQAGALPDPQLQVTYFVESVQTRTGPQEAAIVLSQRFPWFGIPGERERAADTEAEALWYAWQNQNLRVALETGTSYFAYALTHQQVDLVERSLGLLRQMLPSVEERVRGGGSLDTLLRLQVEIGSLTDRLESVRSQREVIAAQLREYLILDEAASLPRPELKPVANVSPNGPALIVALEKNNPELAMLQARIESAQARQALARLDNYPDITLGINYLQIGDPAVPTVDAGKDAWGVTVGISIPLWFERNRGVRAEARANRHALDADYQQRLVALKAEVSRRITQLNDASRTVALYDNELLELARQSAEINRTRYASGEGTLLAWIDSERSRLELELTYWEAVARANKHHLALMILVNQPVSGIQISATPE